jgi:4'-phosphopantetheinyl transferase
MCEIPKKSAIEIDTEIIDIEIKDTKMKNLRARGRRSPWSEAATPPSFPVGHVDIWKLSLDEPSKASVLSSDELARASRFHFDKDRTRFIRCRSVLRFLLAGYLGVPAAEIRFEYSSNGKPQLPPKQNPRGLQFNVSHSADVALIAVGAELQLGIDIEKIREEVDTAALAQRFFSSREGAGLQALPDHLRLAGFFACWTRKEAFLKATGTGLSFPLADFSVTTHPDLPPQLEDLQGDAEAHKRWFLTDLGVGKAYRATLALDRHSPLATFAFKG